MEPIKAFTQPYSVESASFCPEKGRFVAGGGDMWAHLHDYETGAELECNRGAPPPLGYVKHWCSPMHSPAQGILNSYSHEVEIP